MRRTMLSLLLVVCSSISSPAELSRVSVKGTQFVTADGAAIIFRGLDTSDADKLARNHLWTKAYLAEAKAWGANIVRFPVHPAAWRIRGQEEYLGLLDQGVAWAEELGLYVIIDWHSIGNLEAQQFLRGSSELYPVTSYNTTKGETLEFWRIMSKRYGGNNTVAFFELFNEPAAGGDMGECTWAQWKVFMEQVIQAVREEGATAVPLVAGFNYGYDLRPVAEDPIKADGIGYVSHPYPMKRERPWEPKWDEDWGFVAKTHPVFATELGFCLADDKGAHIPVISDESYGQAIEDYCATRGISYSVWCFDPHWSPCLIQDWSFEPTVQGAVFKKIIQGFRH
jgi:hypothetical protein